VSGPTQFTVVAGMGKKLLGLTNKDAHLVQMHTPGLVDFGSPNAAKQSSTTCEPSWKPCAP